MDLHPGLTNTVSLAHLQLEPSLTATVVYLNYPVSHSLLLTYANGSTWEPSLEEEVLAADDSEYFDAHLQVNQSSKLSCSNKLPQPDSDLPRLLANRQCISRVRLRWKRPAGRL
jgi:hypothetical protein